MLLLLFGATSYCFAVVAWLAEGRTLELHSPDGVHACVLRAADQSDATAWFNALHSALQSLTGRAQQQAARVLSASIGDLLLMGWLARRPPDPQVTPHFALPEVRHTEKPKPRILGNSHC